MQHFPLIATLVSLALSSVSAAPLQKREVQCESEPYLKNGTIVPFYYDTSKPAPPPAGLGNTSYVNYNGDSVKALITTQDDGTPYPSALSQFDFYRCKSDYMGTPTSDFDGDFGVLRPTGDIENCVQTSSDAVDSALNVMVVAQCSTIDDRSQQRQTFRWRGRYSDLDFLSTRQGENQHPHPTFFSIGQDTPHHVLQLEAGSDTSSNPYSVHLTYYPRSFTDN